MKTDNRQIRLTEQDLHFIVENAVNSILMENMEDEDLKDYWNATKAVAGRLKDKGQDMVQKMGANIDNKVTGAKDYVQDKWNKGVEAARQTGENIGATFQSNRLNSQIQTAVQTASDALRDLIDLDTKFSKYGTALGNAKAKEAIIKAKKYLDAVGPTSIRDRANLTAKSYRQGRKFSE